MSYLFTNNFCNQQSLMYVQVVSEIPTWEYSFNHIYFTNTEHLEGNKIYAKLSGDKVEQSKLVFDWSH